LCVLFPTYIPFACNNVFQVKSFVDSSNNGLDGVRNSSLYNYCPLNRSSTNQVIPRHILERASGFAIFTIVKAGFLFSARAGSGVVIARLDNGCEPLFLIDLADRR
jgi:lipid-binding SYLF domain-containing protein